MSKLSKLYELLAVESDLRGQAEACRTELKGTFEKKGHHFSKKVVTFKSSVDGVADKVESQLNLQTSVRKELDWIGDKMAKALDIGHQVDVANTQAKGDVVLDSGVTLLKDVPTTSLLRLEHRITEIRELIHSIKTLDPAQGFTEDPDEGKGIYRARDEEKTRGEKTFKFIVMVPPTDKHPAQVKELMVDSPIGTAITQEWSSLITVAEKGDMLDRVEEVLRAVKRARSLANGQEIDTQLTKIGSSVLGYVFNGTK